MTAPGTSAWTIVGWTGQALFFLRSLLQWWESERARRTVVPPLFWWLSLVGSLALSCYALRHGSYVLLTSFGITGLRWSDGSERYTP